MRFVDPANLNRLAERLSKSAYDVYAPIDVDGRAVIARVDAEDPPSMHWNDHRLAESVKPFWFASGKIVARWKDGKPEAGELPAPRAVFGVKACDLKSLQVIDAVFRDHDFQEPNWCAARERNLIVAGDCSDCAASCFCTLLEDAPYPTDGFDLCLSPVDGGYLVEVGSEQGEQVLAEHGDLFGEATTGHAEAREALRARMLQQVQDQNEAYARHEPFEASVDKNVKTRLWDKLAATCVECNACNMVCPTCHCFMLHAVQEDGGGSARACMWDSCFQAGYARMAGAGTPRVTLVERFKNHYYHKFVSFPRNWGLTACSGCGRCIDACMGRIDKRDCLHRLETEWLPSEVLQEMP